MKTWAIVKNKMIWSSLIVAMMASTLVACSEDKKDGGAAPGVPPVYAQGGQNCQGCFADTVLVSMVDAENLSKSVAISLDFFGQTSAVGYNYNDPAITRLYNGPVAAKGKLSIRNLEYATCGAPVGDYMLATLTTGSYVLGVVDPVGYSGNVLRMEGINQHGHRLIARIQAGVIYADSGAPDKTRVNRMGGRVIIESVQGQPCNSFVTVQ